MYEGFTVSSAENHDSCFHSREQSTTIPGPSKRDRQSRGTESASKEKPGIRNEILHAVQVIPGVFVFHLTMFLLPVQDSV